MSPVPFLIVVTNTPLTISPVVLAAMLSLAGSAHAQQPAFGPIPPIEFVRGFQVFADATFSHGVSLVLLILDLRGTT